MFFLGSLYEQLEDKENAAKTFRQVMQMSAGINLSLYEADGEPPRLTISIRNSGGQDATFGAGFLAPTLLTKKSVKTFFVPSDGPSFALVTRTYLRSNPDPDIKASGSGGARPHIVLLDS